MASGWGTGVQFALLGVLAIVLQGVEAKELLLKVQSGGDVVARIYGGGVC